LPNQLIAEMPSPGLAESGSLRIQIPCAYGGSLPDRFHLHGAQRRKCSTALLLIDVINDMEFPDGGDNLLRQTLPAARKIAALKKRRGCRRCSRHLCQ
jgi:hypothetical protein